jgi:hypothetical protein
MPLLPLLGSSVSVMYVVVSHVINCRYKALHTLWLYHRCSCESRDVYCIWYFTFTQLRDFHHRDSRDAVAMLSRCSISTASR